MSAVPVSELKWWLALSSVRGVGWAKFQSLLELHGSPQAAIESLVESGPHGIPGRGVDPSSVREVLSYLGRFEQMVASSVDLGIRILTFEDVDYPRNLLDVDYRPPVIYVKGTLLPGDSKALAVVGTLAPSLEGSTRASRLTRGLVEHGYTIVSGLARGIDTAAHTAVIEANGRTIAVVATGLDIVYPPENRLLFEQVVEHGAVVSQFALGEGPQKHTFPMRNRVMSALALGTIIVEGHSKCGSIIQADFAFQQGRKVFILSNNLQQSDNAWAKEIVNRGGTVVKVIEDVLSNMRPSPLLGQPTQLSLSGIDETTPKSSPTKATGRDVAILFDLDGTLFDSRELSFAAYDYVLNQVYARSVPEAEIRQAVWDSPFRTLGRWLPQGEVKKAYQVYSEAFDEGFSKFGRLFEGVESTLIALREKDYQVGIVTSQPRKRANRVLELTSAFKLGEATTVVTWEDVKERKKPDPYPIQLALKRLPVKPKIAYYVGDTPDDIVAARRASVNAVAATWGATDLRTLEKFAPEFVISSITELVHVVEYETPSRLAY